MCALAVAGAVTMFLELEQGFGGVVRISAEPMRHAIKNLETDPAAGMHLSANRLGDAR
jgi:hypothetical protein